MDENNNVREELVNGDWGASEHVYTQQLTSTDTENETMETRLPQPDDRASRAAEDVHLSHPDLSNEDF